MIALRPFQQAAVDQIERAIADEHRKLLFVAPTGSGKTVVASEFVRRLIANYKRVLFLAHRREIIGQTSRKLDANGIFHGVILAGRDKQLRPMAQVQVASVMTLWSRGIRSSAMEMPPADVVIVDEAHHGRAKTYQLILDAYPDAVVVGLTATPCRGDGRGLGNVFEEMIEAPQVQELIDLGFLVPTKIYAPVQNVDRLLRGVRTQTGDYVVSQLEQRMNTDALVGDIVEHWLKYAERRRTVAFAVDVAHSIHIRDEFIRAGVRAEHLDGGTAIPEREAILERLASGETEVVSNCGVLIEGWDLPAVACAVLARPTKQMGLYRQMIGRILRPAEGKQNAIVLDHSGAVWRYGRPEDHVEWTLDTDRRAENATHQKRQRGEGKLLECPSCQVVIGIPPCGHCGWEPAPRRGRDVDVVDGELGLVIGGRVEAPVYDLAARRHWHAMMRGAAVERGKNPKWAYFLYQQKFGCKPDWSWRDDCLEPTEEVRRYVRSRAIAYAKARNAA
jgi:DNA repair protein RadD